jgi:hypothetical protein
MQNINRPDGDNNGGLETFYFLPVEQLAQDPPPGTITQNLQLAAGAVFYAFYCTLGSLQYNEGETQDNRGTRYKQTLKGYVPKDTPELQAALAELSGRRFVIIYKDFNGFFKLVGSRQYWLQFSRELDTGNSPSGRNGFGFSFSGESTRKAAHYLGSFPVSEQPDAGQPPDDPYANLVKVVDGAGQLILTLSPGETLVVESGFSVGFRILSPLP